MNELNGYDVEDLQVGMKAEYAKTLTEADVVLFAGASGDINPIHLNEDYAKTTSFGGRIVHGLLTASLISAAVGNQLPGPGSIYMSQSMRFKAPVKSGDTVRVEVIVRDVIEEKSRVVMETNCYVGDTLVIEGEALMMTSSMAERKKARVIA